MKLIKVITCIRGGHWHSLYYDHLVPEWMKNYSPPGGSYNYAATLLKPHEYIRDLYLQAKWFWQRGTRGYSDRDVWSVDWHLTEYMGNVLRDLRDQVHGCPIIDTGRVIADFNDCDCLTMEEWKFTINYIAETFDLGRKIEEYEISVEEMPNAMKRFKHGMSMFTEYFFNLWD